MWLGDSLFCYIFFNMPPKRKSWKRKHPESSSDPTTSAAATDSRSTGADGSSANSDLSVSLTRNDIPMIVQEITRQLRPENNEVQASSATSLVPSMLINLAYCLVYSRNGTTPLLRFIKDPFVTNTPWSQGSFSSPGGAVVVHRADTGTFVVPHVCLRSWLDNC